MNRINCLKIEIQGSIDLVLCILTHVRNQFYVELFTHTKQNKFNKNWRIRVRRPFRSKLYTIVIVRTSKTFELWTVA